MRYRVLFCLAALLVCSCAPALTPEVMKEALLNPPYGDLRENPGAHEGKLYVMGGIIVETHVLAEGSLIEAVYVPVDARGYVEDTRTSPGRYLALYPAEVGLLDPLIYRKDRLVTVAGVFSGIETRRLQGMDYAYPLFTIREIHLWDDWRRTYYYGPYPYWWYDPWWWYGPRWYGPGWRTHW